ncbi:MAG: T9SS type A sorting domain-containing protein [Alphaproteobacteria bacterium]|nr:T9SS type A sorting domain-containing protein [Alphaproteobacteria bacterium]
MKKYLPLLLLLFATLNVTNAQTKHVIIEELTGTWCQWCSGGTHYMDSLASVYPNVIGIAIHTGDVMENEDYAAASGLLSAPSANIDRGGQGTGISQWFYWVSSAFAETPKADIEVFTNFDQVTRLLTARVKATFFTSASGNYRLSAIVTEDGVTGPAPQYNQTNIYSGGGHGYMGGFELLPSTIPANMIAYNHVGRALLGGYNGQTGSVPSSVAAGDTVSYTFTCTIPANWDENYIRVAGLLIAPDNTLDNAGRSTYLDGSNNATPLFMSSPVTTGFEGTLYSCDIYASDPDDQNLTLTAINLPSWLTLSAATTVGMIHTKATLTGTPVLSGNYPVEIVVSDGLKSDTLSFTIVVESALPGTWQLVGDAGFAAAEYNLGIEADMNGTLYTLISNNYVCNVYQKTPFGNWTNYGNLNEQGSMGRIRIGSDGLTPYVAFSKEGPVKVKKYVSGAWVQIGTSPASGVQIGFDLDSADVPYVALEDFGSNYKGVCYKYNGSTWEKLGGTAYSGSNYGVWNDLRVNKSTGDVYVLWNNFNGNLAHVSKWNGNSWTLLGGSAVSNDPVSYSQNLIVDEYTDDVYVVIASGTGSSNGVLNAYKYEGTAWSQIGSDEADGPVIDVATTMNDQRILLIAYVDLNSGNSVSAMSYFDGTWDYVGPRGFSNAVSSSCGITSYQNMPYVIYIDGSASDKATIRYYDNPVVTGTPEYPVVKDAITIYPNPANPEINISGLSGPVEARIYNIQGVIIWKGIVQKNDKISTASYSNGVYLLRTDTKSSVFIVKHN